MPDSVPRIEEILTRACYLPALSHPILLAIAATQENAKMHSTILDECHAAADAIYSIDQLSWLHADLVCALNGTDYLPLVAGFLASSLRTRLSQ